MEICYIFFNEHCQYLKNCFVCVHCMCSFVCFAQLDTMCSDVTLRTLAYSGLHLTWPGFLSEFLAAICQQFTLASTVSRLVLRATACCSFLCCRMFCYACMFDLVVLDYVFICSGLVCIFVCFYFSLDHFTFVFSNLGLLDDFFHYRAKRLTGKNVSEITYCESSGTLNCTQFSSACCTYSLFFHVSFFQPTLHEP